MYDVDDGLIYIYIYIYISAIVCSKLKYRDTWFYKARDELDTCAYYQDEFHTDIPAAVAVFLCGYSSLRFM